jgi:ribosomal protein S17
VNLWLGEPIVTTRSARLAVWTRRDVVKALALVVTTVLVPGIALAASPAPAPLVAQAAPAPAAPEAAKPKGQAAAVVTARGTVEAIDKEKQTVTLKGPKRTLTVQVRDPKKLEAIKVGDPVVAKYYESMAIEVKKAGTAVPGTTVQQGTATSQPGATPAGAVGQQVTVTATIVAIDKAAHTVTIKGPEGNSETVKARDPKNLEAVKVGDLVEITYTRALAIALDKPVK